ncbi:unnamed protein product, partial [Polarella glacialis]
VAVASCCAAAARWEQALALALPSPGSGARSPSTVVFNAAAAACARAARWELCLELLDSMAQRRAVPDDVSYSIAIHSLGERGGCSQRWPLALALLSRRRPARLSAVNAAIAACGSASQWQQSCMLLFAADVADERDVISFNSSIAACERAWKWEHSLKLISDMDRRRLDPDVVSFTAAANACEQARQWSLALLVLDQLRARGLRPA